MPKKGECIMAKNQAIRIRPTALQADLNACTALQSLSGYKPSNPAYATTAATDKLSAMQAAQEAEVNAQNALDSARDNAAAAEWDFHNTMLGVKDQVVAQYGKDSNELQSMGLKKVSERKAPKRKAKKAAA
jgi:hypothetical protein